jgi:hypothetical protein
MCFGLATLIASVCGGYETGQNWWQNGSKSLFTTGFNGGKISVPQLWGLNEKKSVARLSPSEVAGA